MKSTVSGVPLESDYYVTVYTDKHIYLFRRLEDAFQVDIILPETGVFDGRSDSVTISML